MQTVEKKKFEFDPKLAVAFVKSVRKVLSTMASVETVIERPRLKITMGPEYEYSGIIGFSGEIVGTVVVSFQHEAAVQLVNAFACSVLEPGSGDFSDAIGELTNMIVGAAKTDLGGNSSISTPSVVMGQGHIVCRPSDIPCLVIPCKTSAGEFAVEVSVKSV
jgi:chemotaxis protein CheX